MAATVAFQRGDRIVVVKGRYRGDAGTVVRTDDGSDYWGQAGVCYQPDDQRSRRRTRLDWVVADEDGAK